MSQFCDHFKIGLVNDHRRCVYCQKLELEANYDKLKFINAELLGALTYIHSVIAAQNNMGANWQTDSVMRRLLDVLAPIQKVTK